MWSRLLTLTAIVDDDGHMVVSLIFENVSKPDVLRAVLGMSKVI